MSLSNSFPGIRASLVLDFCNSQQLDPRVTFTRNLAARFYDGETVAKAEENLLVDSNSLPSVNEFTVTTNDPGTTAPDGTSTANKGLETIVNSHHNAAKSVVVGSVVHTFSAHVKGGLGRDWAVLRVPDSGGTYRSAFFDIQNGVVGTVGTNLSNATITLVRDGWYRISITFTPPATTIFPGVGSADADNSTSFVGDVTKGIYFWGAQLELRSAPTAYTPTTTAPITNYVPQLMTAAANVPRFDFDPLTRVCRGLLIEESRQNLITRSEEFNDAAWTKTRSSAAANTNVAPDGTLTADTLVEDTTASDTHLVSQAATTTAAAWTFSVYVKAAGRSWIQLSNSTVANATAFFNLGTGAVGTVGAAATAAITSVGNGWYRCALTATATAASNTFQVLLASDGSTTSYTGDGYSGIFLWGAQLEVGAFPTSYIATAGSDVTRPADAATMTGTNFSSWYRADEGTLFGDGTSYAVNPVYAGLGSLNLTSAASANRIEFGLQVNVTNMYSVVNNSVQVSALVSGGLASKIAFGYKLNDYAISGNGAAVGTDTSALVPVVDRLFIGGDFAARYWNGHIRKLAFYSRRLSNSELVALTR
jgi:hypothetical protein